MSGGGVVTGLRSGFVFGHEMGCKIIGNVYFCCG